MTKKAAHVHQSHGGSFSLSALSPREQGGMSAVVLAGTSSLSEIETGN